MPALLAAMTLLALLALSGPAAADAPEEPVEAWTRIDEQAFAAYVEQVMTTMRVPSAAVVVVHSDKGVVFARGFGQLADGAPVTPDTRFRIAHLSRSLTALAALHLIEAGHLDPDASISALLPELVAQGGADLSGITARHLLTHTSGLSDDIDIDLWGDLDGPFPPLPVQAPPGQQHQEAEVNDALLGLIIAAITDQPFEDAIEAILLSPLDLARAENRGEPVQDTVAQGHKYAFALTFASDEPASNPRSAPARGLLASAQDIASVLLVMLDGEASPLKPPEVKPPIKGRKKASADEARKIAATTSATGSKVSRPMASRPKAVGAMIDAALRGEPRPLEGWSRSERGEVTFIEQRGASGSFSASMALVPERKLGIVVLTDINSFDAMAPRAIMTGFVDLLLERTTKVFAFVEIIVRLVMGMMILVALLDLVRQIWRKSRLGAPLAADAFKRRALRCAIVFGVPLALAILGLWWLGEGVGARVATQPDLVAAILIGCPLSMVRSALKIGNDVFEEDLIKVM